MQKTNLTACLVAATTFLVFSLFAFRETSLLQLLSIGFFFISGFTSIAVLIITIYQKAFFKLQNYIAVILPILTFFSGPFVGHKVREMYFLHHLPELTEFVNGLPEKKAKNRIYWNDIPVSYNKTETGHKVAFFWWGSGFPVKHTVIAYHSGNESDALKTFKQNWRSGKKLAKHWLILKD